MAKVNFKKGNSFSSYEEGTIYFEKSTHLVKVGLSDSSCEIYAGVRSASWNSSTKVLTIVNQEGTDITLDFADVASAAGVNSLLATLRTDINDVSTRINDVSTRLSDVSTNLANKLNKPTTAGTGGQILELDNNGNPIWASLPAATNYGIAIDSSTGGSTDSFVKKYSIYQGASDASTLIGTIDIPKDLVVTSGSCVAGTWSGNTFTEGSGDGHAIKLVIANQTDPVYINTLDLVDIYTAQQNATQVQLAISNNEISATIVNGAVTTEKLDSSVQSALGKANSAVQSVTESTSNGKISVDGTDVAIHGLGSAAYEASTAFATAAQGEKADSALQASDISTGTTAGAISVKGTAVSVYGLGSAAYEASTAFATAAQGTAAENAIKSVTGETAVSNSSYVAVSVEASTNSSKAVTLTSHANVTTHDVSTAVASSADGLALASDVKSYVADYTSDLHNWQQFN